MNIYLKRFMFLIFKILIGLILFGHGFSQEPENTERWTISQSPKIIQGEYIVPKDKTLIIEPGVVVAFEPLSSLRILGTLIATGLSDEENRIVFTSTKDMEFAETLYRDIRGIVAFEEGKDEWIKISFQKDKIDQPSILENCILRYSSEVIECEKAYPILLNILMERNRESKINLNGYWTDIKRGYNSFSTRLTSLECTFHIPDTVYNNRPFSIGIAVTNIGNEEINHISPYGLTLIGSGLLEWEILNPDKKLFISPGDKKEIMLECTIKGAKSGDFRLKTFIIGKEMRSDVLITSSARVSDFHYFSISSPPGKIAVPPPPGKPNAPTELRIVERIEGGVIIAWNDQSDDESGFIVQVRKGIYSTWATLSMIDANVSSYKIMGIDSKEPVSFRIKAFNEAGESPFSNVLEIEPVIIVKEDIITEKSKPFYKKSGQLAEQVWE
jgi:hypothetical protein